MAEEVDAAGRCAGVNDPDVRGDFGSGLFDPELDVVVGLPLGECERRMMGRRPAPVLGLAGPMSTVGGCDPTLLAVDVDGLCLRSCSTSWPTYDDSFVCVPSGGVVGGVHCIVRLAPDADADELTLSPLALLYHPSPSPLVPPPSE